MTRAIVPGGWHETAATARRCPAAVIGASRLAAGGSMGAPSAMSIGDITMKDLTRLLQK
jgi:hypothetical protein